MAATAGIQGVGADRSMQTPTGMPTGREGRWQSMMNREVLLRRPDAKGAPRAVRGARRLAVTAVAVRVVFWLLAWPASSAASPCAAIEAGQPGATCTCPEPFDAATPPGIVWQGPGPEPSLPALAHLLAPVLWFSSDEPLLVLRPGEPIPQPHPCDAPARGPVVYYQATEIVLRGEARVDGTGEADPRFFEKVDHFVLKFFFYYDEDYGLGRHPHDLEAVNVLVYLEYLPGGCLRVRVPRIEGLAHGLDWYSNVLRVERDTVFPITILVEEGKHASVPDRNADGVYTPGYDVNVRVNDAWGLRDVLGSAVLLGARYAASMSKPRADAFRLLPPEGAPGCGTRRAVRAGGEHLGRYELRPATAVPVCAPPGPEPDRLRAMMRYHRFGAEWPADQHTSDLARVLSDPENLFRWVSAINARLDSQRVGVSVQGPGFDAREVWIVPRLHVNRGWGIDALLTPSASRWADWYVAMGYERGLTAGRGGAVAGRGVNGFASEIGVKLRATATGRARWALLGYRFGGVRLGVRANGFTRLREPRVIVEVGAGAF